MLPSRRDNRNRSVNNDIHSGWYILADTNWARFLHPVRGSLCCLSVWMTIMLSWVKLYFTTASTRLKKLCKSKILFSDWTHGHYLIWWAAETQICMTPSTTSPGLIWKWRSPLSEWPETELSSAANCLKASRGCHLSKNGLWLLGDPGPQRARRDISASSIW